MPVRKAFTLIELLVVIGVILVLAALLLGVFSNGKRDAHRATSLSNLHQCGAALVLYANENDGQYPEIDAARRELKRMPTCDPEDHWRKDCQEIWGDPLVGSYAYFRGIDIYKGPDGQSKWSSGLNVLLVSIFYADPVPKPFHGQQVSSGAGPNYVPSKGVIRLNSDLTAYTVNDWGIPPNEKVFMNWAFLFIDFRDSPVVPIGR